MAYQVITPSSLFVPHLFVSHLQASALSDSLVDCLLEAKQV